MKEKIHQWADGFLKSKVESMTNQIAHEFVAISLGVPPSVMADEIHDQAAGLEDLGVEIIHSRSKHIGLEITGQVFALLRTISDSPGTIVMWLHALRSWQVRNGGKVIDMDTLSMQLFPLGFPTEESLHAAWQAQKTEGGTNLLDACNADTFREVVDAAAG